MNPEVKKIHDALPWYWRHSRSRPLTRPPTITFGPRDKNRYNAIVRLRGVGYSYVTIGRMFRISAVRASQILTPHKHQARMAVTRALFRGTLTRPKHCKRCGNLGEIEAHHTDYSKHLKVVWLCVGCHRKQTTKDRERSLMPAYKETLACFTRTTRLNSTALYKLRDWGGVRAGAMLSRLEFLRRLGFLEREPAGGRDGWTYFLKRKGSKAKSK